MKEDLNKYIAEKIHDENRRRIRALLKECVYLEQVQRAFVDFPQGEIQEIFDDLRTQYLEEIRAKMLREAYEAAYQRGRMIGHVMMFQEFHFSKSDAIKDFAECFSVSEQEAEKFVNENWDEEAENHE